MPRALFAACTPVVLDAVSDWWDEQGAGKWPDDKLDPCYRLPWHNVWAEWIDKNEGHAISKGVLLGEFILKATASAADFLGAIYPDVTLGQHFRDANVLTMGTHFVWDGTQTPAVQMGTLWWGCRDAMPIRGDDGSIALLAVGELLKRAAPNGNAWAALDVWWLFTSLLSVTGIPR